MLLPKEKWGKKESADLRVAIELGDVDDSDTPATVITKAYNGVPSLTFLRHFATKDENFMKEKLKNARDQAKKKSLKDPNNNRIGKCRRHHHHQDLLLSFITFITLILLYFLDEFLTHQQGTGG